MTARIAPPQREHSGRNRIHSQSDKEDQSDYGVALQEYLGNAVQHALDEIGELQRIRGDRLERRDDIARG
jgi:anti-sigma regulatory factor (Ser/Thr protein kinase)